MPARTCGTSSISSASPASSAPTPITTASRRPARPSMQQRGEQTVVRDRYEEPTSVEPRWPVALAIGSFIAITVSLHFIVPHRPTLGPAWLIPAVELAMLALLLAADPARLAEHRRPLRRAALALMLILAVAVFAST